MTSPDTEVSAPRQSPPGPAIGDLTKANASDRIQEAPVIPILLIIAGLYLIYFGTHWFRDASVVWPSDPVKALLQGKAIPGRVAPETASATLTSYETQQAGSDGGTSGGTAPFPRGLPPGGSAAKNRSLGKLLAGKYGWGTGENWKALDYGWGHLESGWNSKVENEAGSGAFGIAQALGHGNDNTKGTLSNAYGPVNGMKFPAKLYQAANSGNASAQIEWGLFYIKQVYGSPDKVPGWTGGSYSGY